MILINPFRSGTHTHTHHHTQNRISDIKVWVVYLLSDVVEMYDRRRFHATRRSTI
jgi:hypothetical protein